MSVGKLHIYKQMISLTSDLDSQSIEQRINIPFFSTI